MPSVAVIGQEFSSLFQREFSAGKPVPSWAETQALLFPKSSHLAWSLMCMIFSTVGSPVSFQEGKASSCGCNEPVDVITLGKEG